MDGNTLIEGETGNRTKALGHLALHYKAGDGDLVLRLFRSLGLRVEDLGPARNGDRFFKVVVDSSSAEGDGFFYVATVAPYQVAFEQALNSAFSADKDAQALAAYRTARSTDPEAGFHIGVRYEGLDALEQAVLAIEAAMREEPRLAGRIGVTRLKAPAGKNAEIDARMSRAPVFKADDREAFGEGGVQVFIQTDLVAGGLLALGQTFELDYLFPGRATREPVKVYEGAD
jgi:hypothetical protein